MKSMMKRMMATIGLSGVLVTGVTPAFAEQAAPKSETSFSANTKALTKTEQELKKRKKELAKAKASYKKANNQYKDVQEQKEALERTIVHYDQQLDPEKTSVIDQVIGAGSKDLTKMYDLVQIQRLKDHSEEKLVSVKEAEGKKEKALSKAKKTRDEKQKKLAATEKSLKKIKKARAKMEPKKFLLPTTGRISQHWGSASGQFGYTFHNGLDVAAGVGTPIYAAEDGKVISVKSQGPYGKHVMIEHKVKNQKWTTLYAHMNDIDVKKGQKVKQGQHIGEVGSTGNSSGPHLHFEIHKGGYSYSPTGPASTVNPMKVVEKVKLG